MCHSGMYIHEITTDSLLFCEMEYTFQIYYWYGEGRFCTCWYFTLWRNWMGIGRHKCVFSFFVWQFITDSLFMTEFVQTNNSLFWYELVNDVLGINFNFHIFMSSFCFNRRHKFSVKLILIQFISLTWLMKILFHNMNWFVRIMSL